MARNTQKSKIQNELLDVLGWPRMPLPQEGVYFSKDGAKLVMEMLSAKKSTKTKAKKEETSEQLHARIAKSFADIADITEGTIGGAFRATIISGPPGLGKSYTVEEKIKAFDPNGVNSTIISGKMTPPALFKQLWDHREEGQILVIDDCDNIFQDDVSLNLLKAACDSQTNRPRVVSYLSEAPPKTSDKDGSMIEQRFEFNGTIIFITNTDFDDYIERGNRLAPHFEALKSRSMYISLEMRTMKEYMVRVEQIADAIFEKHGKTCQRDVLEFMNKNIHNLSEVSARMATKIAGIRKAMPDRWKGMAARTCFKKEF
jgi:hypothetical protein